MTLKGSNIAVDLPPENHQHHQKHEISKKPESTPPGLCNYGCVLWIFELFVKFIAFLSTLFTLTSIWAPVENCLDLISEQPWIGSFLLITWILWIPAIGFIWCAFRTKKFPFFLTYAIYNGVFQIIKVTVSIIDLFSFFVPTIKEALSNPKVMDVVNDFNQSMSIFWCGVITMCCYLCLEVLTHYREEYFLGKTDA